MTAPASSLRDESIIVAAASRCFLGGAVFGRLALAFPRAVALAAGVAVPDHGSMISTALRDGGR